MEKRLSQDVMELVQQVFKLKLGKTSTEKKLSEAIFNLSGFARTLLKMQMEKYGNVEN